MFARSALLLASLLLVWSAQAGPIYKCVDENGKVTYSDKPCPGADNEKLNIKSERTDESAVSERVESRKEEIASLNKEKSEAAKAAEEARKKKEEQKAACEKAREDLQRAMRARRMYKGEGENRTYLSDEEIDARRKAAQEKVKELCGG